MGLGLERTLHYNNYNCIIIYICIISQSYTIYICTISHSPAIQIPTVKEIESVKDALRRVPAKVYMIHFRIVSNKYPSSIVDMWRYTKIKTICQDAA